MVRCVAKRIDLQILKEIMRHFVKKPVKNHATFDSTLRVQDKDNPLHAFLVKCLFHKYVTGPNIVGRVTKAALDEALYNVEDYAASICCSAG